MENFIKKLKIIKTNILIVCGLLLFPVSNTFACPDIDGFTDRNCDQKLVIVFFGDSITFGSRDEAGLGYPGRLKILHPNITIVNLGLPGESSYKGKVRAGRTIPYFPEADYVLTLEGVNDYFIKTKSTIQTRDNLLAIKNIGTNVGAQSLLANLIHTTRNTGQGSWISSVNSKIFPYRSIDFYSLGKSIISSDQLHPNGQGYQAMAGKASSTLTLISIGNKPKDLDGDGIYDFAETRFGANPNLADTDGDGILDGEEVFRYNSNPNSTDSDGDGFLDNFEVNVLRSDPSNPNLTPPKIQNYRILPQAGKDGFIGN